MATVNIVPIPDGFRRHPERWWPCYPPIFEGEVTQEDRELAWSFGGHSMRHPGAGMCVFTPTQTFASSSACR
jgi:hypothetical protein